MSFAVGLRVYKLITPIRNARAPKDTTGWISNKELLNFLRDFLKDHEAPANRRDLQRGWRIELRHSTNPHMIHGYAHYGTYGFESLLIDGKTRTERYKRQTADLEEIPLYFKYWIPENDNFGLFAFQSFSGRSCIQIITDEMRGVFERKYSKNTLRTQKLMPSEANNKEIANAKVKRLTMIKTDVSSDLADRYLGNGSSEKIDLEFIIKSKRRGSLGILSEISSMASNSKESMLVHDGIHFDTAKAVIEVGGRYRTVGVLGYSNDAGLIDLTEQIERGANGHPLFAEISAETDDILKGFYKTTKSKE